jgi:hypothetical protein
MYLGLQGLKGEISDGADTGGRATCSLLCFATSEQPVQALACACVGSWSLPLVNRNWPDPASGPHVTGSQPQGFQHNLRLIKYWITKT